MLRDITIGQHFPGNSLVHRFDPRLKLVLTIAYIVLLFAASNPLGLALSILFLAAMYKVAKIPGKMIMKSLKPILPIVIFTALLNLFFVSGEGEPLVHIWFLTIYAEGVRYAVLMAVRVMALIAGTSLLTNFLATTWSYNPTHAVTWVVWAVPRSLATTGGIIVYFLFLQVLRCFSSLR